MKKTRHRWFLVSLAHPVVSTVCIFLGSTISGGPLGWIGYAAALLAFLINLPGVILIKQFYQSTPVESTSTKDLFYFSMIVITWLLIVVPACYLTSQFSSSRAP